MGVTHSRWRRPAVELPRGAGARLGAYLLSGCARCGGGAPWGAHRRILKRKIPTPQPPRSQAPRFALVNRLSYTRGIMLLGSIPLPPIHHHHSHRRRPAHRLILRLHATSCDTHPESYASRTSCSPIGAVAVARSACACFLERVVRLHNAPDEVARRRSGAELHHLGAIPDGEGQARR